jgi:hypothetical protein
MDAIRFDALLRALTILPSRSRGVLVTLETATTELWLDTARMSNERAIGARHEAPAM